MKTFQDYLCLNDGSDQAANIQAAIDDAAANGHELTGEGKEYCTTADIHCQNNSHIQDVTFKRLNPDAFSKVLRSDGKNGVRILRTRIDRNGDGTNAGQVAGPNGCIADAIGFRLDGGHNHQIEDLEVFGNDSGTGIHGLNLDASTTMIRPYVHDILCERHDATIPLDDMIQGLWLTGAQGVKVIDYRSHDLTTRTYGAAGVDVVAGTQIVSSYFFSLSDADLGTAMTIPGAGPGGSDLTGIILEVFHGKSCRISNTASVTVQNGTCTFTGSIVPRYSRGFAAGNTRYCSLIRPHIERVDQGVDWTGDDGNIHCFTDRPIVIDPYTVGVKFANSTVNGICQNGVVVRAGLHGYLASGCSDPTGAHRTREVYFIDCVAENTGYQSHWTAETRMSDFTVLKGDYYSDYPQNVQFIRPKSLNGGYVHWLAYNDAAPPTTKPNVLIDPDFVGGQYMTGETFGF